MENRSNITRFRRAQGRRTGKRGEGNCLQWGGNGKVLLKKDTASQNHGHFKTRFHKIAFNISPVVRQVPTKHSAGTLQPWRADGKKMFRCCCAPPSGRRLEDRNLLKLRSPDSSCPFFLSDNSIWGQ